MTSEAMHDEFVIFKEKFVTLVEKVECNQREIHNLREWKHDLAQKPNSDGIKLQLMEREVTGLGSAISRNTELTEKVLSTLNGDDDKPGLKGRIDRIERGMASINRLGWLVVGGLITCLTGVLLLGIKIWWNSITKGDILP